MTETIIIKPIEVWDTRSPHFYYNSQLKKLNREYWSQIICTLEQPNLLYGEDETNLIVKCRKTKIGHYAWKQYKKSFDDNQFGQKSLPTNQDFKQDLRKNTYNITRNSIVNILSLFESFMHCWTLNYFLTKLENGQSLTTKENKLNNSFQKNRPPSPSYIIDQIEIVSHILKKIKYPLEIESDMPNESKTISYELNGYDSIKFWIKWRNTIIHKGGIVNSKFKNEHSELWDLLKRKFNHLPSIESGNLLSNSPNVFRSVATMNYEIVKDLKEEIIKMSNGHRGHIFAPNERRNGKIPFNEIPDYPPKLIIQHEKEHQPSLTWTTLKTEKEKTEYLNSTLPNTAYLKKLYSDKN